MILKFADNNNAFTIVSLWAPVVAVSFLFSSFVSI